ncbi:MAG: DEAD/DEAH box helicase [Deltaproteobacteria bacterium]|nr:DEAD/DEAH box helicase [Deltaproteobacteria bacterium]
MGRRLVARAPPAVTLRAAGGRRAIRRRRRSPGAHFSAELVGTRSARSAAMATVSFDRGTLRIDGDPGGFDFVRYDARTGFHRAPAHRYRELLGAVDDRVAGSLLVPKAPITAPTLRPYQQQAIDSFETFGRRGVVVLPTGSGKTRVACAAIARAGCSALVLVPTRALLEQWRAVIATMYPGPIGVVGDGELSIEPITVMTFESAYRRLDAYGHRFGMLVVDEAHHFASGLRAEALEMCVAPVRLGLTATPPDPDSPGERRLRDLLGPVVCELGIDDLAGKHLADFDIVRVHVALAPDERAAYERDIAPYEELRREIRRVNPNADFQAIIGSIARVPGGRDVLAAMQRATKLAGFPRAKRDVVLTLATRHWPERVLAFTAVAEDAYAIGEDLLVPVITAETAREEREEVLARFSAGEVRMIASARVLNEGIDVPAASVAIIAGGALGAREHTQRIGRILRPQEGKRAIAYELVTLDTIDEARTRAKRRRLAARTSAAAR